MLAALKLNMMAYIVMVGSDAYIGTTGILSYIEGARRKEFFRVRQIFHARDLNSHMAVSVDVKDAANQRQVKLHNSKPVVIAEGLDYSLSKRHTKVVAEDGSTVIKVEQLPLNSDKLPQNPQVQQLISNGTITGAIMITGQFTVNGYSVDVTEERTRIGTIQTSGNVMAGAGGMILTEDGIGLG